MDFRFPLEFVIKVFEAYPPDSSQLGAKLFPEVKHIQFLDRTRSIWLRMKEHGISNQPDPSFYTYCEIYRKEPFTNGYMLCSTRQYGKLKNGKYKLATPDLPKWRKYIKGFVTKDGKSYHLVTGDVGYNNAWRESPEVVKMAKAYGLLNNEFALDKVPIRHDYRIHYNGNGEIVVVA